MSVLRCIQSEHMARRLDKQKAVEMRQCGYSYAQIVAVLGVSKSTLSMWLRDIPLTDSRLRELRDHSQTRIAKTRATKLKKKRDRREEVYKKVSRDLSTYKNDLFIGGFYLYWGEGTKSAEYTVALTSTDPAIIKTFIAWLNMLGVSTDQCRVKLHLYNDQSLEEIQEFWQNQTGIPKDTFYKPYIKKTLSVQKSYIGMFGYGTCTIYYHNRDMYEYVMAGIQVLRDRY